MLSKQLACLRIWAGNYVIEISNCHCVHFVFNCCSCPPRTFLPALCRVFLDECAPDNVLEVTARAITYYLDVSAECTRRIVAVEGAIKALCNRLVVAEMSSRTSKDLAEQCIKVSPCLSLYRRINILFFLFCLLRTVEFISMIFFHPKI